MKRRTITERAPPIALIGIEPVTSDDFGGRRPPVTTAVRWSEKVRLVIADYARTHTDKETKARFGCSAHFVGKLRKKLDVPSPRPAFAVPTRAKSGAHRSDVGKPANSTLSCGVTTIRWHDEQSAGFTDLIPETWFLDEGYFRGQTHTVRGPKAGEYDAKCDVRVVSPAR
jgi:hypothetical protein